MNDTQVDHGEVKVTGGEGIPLDPGRLGQELWWSLRSTLSAPALLSSMPRYEEEVALRATAENEFVVLKKVSKRAGCKGRREGTHQCHLQGGAPSPC